MILLDENVTKVLYISKYNMVCSYIFFILICYFNKINYLKNFYFFKKKIINFNDFYEIYD